MTDRSDDRCASAERTDPLRSQTERAQSDTPSSQKIAPCHTSRPARFFDLPVVMPAPFPS